MHTLYRAPYQPVQSLISDLSGAFCGQWRSAGSAALRLPPLQMRGLFKVHFEKREVRA